MRGLLSRETGRWGILVIVVFLLLCGAVVASVVPKTGTFQRSVMESPVSDALAQRSVKILATHSNGELTECSGFLSGPDAVVTAGHCVQDPTATYRLQVAAPQFVTTTLPFGECTGRDPHTRLTGTNVQDPLDYGTLKVASCPVTNLNPTGTSRVGEITGWWNLKAAVPGHLAEAKLTLLGYPGNDLMGRMWSLQTTSELVECGPLLAHLPVPCPFSHFVQLSGGAPAGNSGGVVYQVEGGDAAVVGILVASAVDGEQSSARIIDQDVIRDVASWTGDAA